MRWLFLLFIFVLTVSLLNQNSVSSYEPFEAKPLPAFTHTDPKEWINSPPLSLADLKGQVVLIDIWTFDCWNCYRSFPWLNDLEKKYQEQGLKVIGVHTPEFEHEKVRENIEAKAKKFKLHHAIMMDNDFSYWRALNNRYWPTYYLVDKKGNIRYKHIGETHKNDRKAIALENFLKKLLAE